MAASISTLCFLSKLNLSNFHTYVLSARKAAQLKEKKRSSRRVKTGGGRWRSCETGVRPSFEWNSLPGSEFIRISVALWLAEERWNENHGKLLTPAQELRRNAQRLLWCGGTEPALFLCLLHQSNRDCGEVGEGGERENEGGREENIVRAGLRSENEGVFFPPFWSGTVKTCIWN